jgi:hypothetical protein
VNAPQCGLPGSACREQLALLSKTAQLVAQSAPQGVELKSVQRQRILDAARQAKLTASSEQRKPRTSRRILTLSLLSVAALALCGLGIWIFHESNQNAARGRGLAAGRRTSTFGSGDDAGPAAFRQRSEADSPRDAATGLDGTLTASVANKPDPTRAD